MCREAAVAALFPYSEGIGRCGRSRTKVLSPQGRSARTRTRIGTFLLRLVTATLLLGLLEMVEENNAHRHISPTTLLMISSFL